MWQGYKSNSTYLLKIHLEHPFLISPHSCKILHHQKTRGNLSVINYFLKKFVQLKSCFSEYITKFHQNNMPTHKINTSPAKFFCLLKTNKLINKLNKRVRFKKTCVHNVPRWENQKKKKNLWITVLLLMRTIWRLLPWGRLWQWECPGEWDYL